ncbi:bifunctional hydroxymethylpyrimidine kinase/phosphomethylpyrimidine kinase [Pelistega europaea]|uniref:hydroxymethylpyrimidine kinase n=1 Tax=Pelistega europaea TaxID=106147 RepID=A0A7Y4LB34_9BURK|nr:bifunctional hydroxymethylpyrimidine kinase/phosphomethylpyrimidine kinase [Pelistega europaea]NOL49162.1 bifunctional hydroxymethylpyrimidine kinase/phosphomethylpyrimidine kinase [Pelistega europaea]
MIKNTLTIAGVDPSGGAGVLADVKTMSALGTFSTAVIAALTAQNTCSVTGILPIAPDFIGLQIDTLFEDVRIDGVKIGMLGCDSVIKVVADKLEKYSPPFIVLDPVMVAKSGDLLLEEKAVSALIEALVTQAHMITPNLPEAGVMLQRSTPETPKEMYKFAEDLHKLMSDKSERWVLLKGGHLSGSDTIDLLFNGDKMIEIPNQKIQTKNTHGTGCSLSSAICALQARLQNVPEATHQAIAFVHNAIRHADELSVGKGHGPIHHFQQLWAAQS